MQVTVPVSVIMTRDPVTVTEDATLTRIQSILNNNHFHHLPVVDNKGNLLGIISKEDIGRATYLLSINTGGREFSKREMATVTAKHMMSTYPVFLQPEDSVDLAADIFLANKFHALPILDDGQLVGILTTHDLVRYAFSEVQLFG